MMLSTKTLHGGDYQTLIPHHRCPNPRCRGVEYAASSDRVLRPDHLGTATQETTNLVLRVILRTQCQSSVDSEHAGLRVDNAWAKDEDVDRAVENMAELQMVKATARR